MRNLLGLLICLPLLSGATCQKKQPVSPATEIVELPVRQFRALDPKLTAPCGPKAEGRLSEVLEVAKKRGLQLDDCDRRMTEIRNAQPMVEDRSQD